MPKRPTLPTSDQTTLVDTFTCSIAILFVLILSLKGISTQPFSIVPSELVLLCSTGENGAEPAFRFASDHAVLPHDAAQTQHRLETLVPTDSLSARITVAHGPQDDTCRDAARRLVDAHNEAATTGGAGTQRPYLVLDMLVRSEAEKPAADPL